MRRKRRSALRYAGLRPARRLRWCRGSGSASKYLTIELNDAVTFNLALERRLLIGRLLLQDSLAAPYGEPAKGVTDFDPLRQFAQFAYLCALALVVRPKHFAPCASPLPLDCFLARISYIETRVQVGCRLLPGTRPGEGKQRNRHATRSTKKEAPEI